VTENPYVFIVGAARSGTTLLQRMLDAHPQLAVVNETYWVERKFRERNGLTRAGEVTPALVPKLLESPKFHHMGVTEADLQQLLSEADPMPYALLVSRIFDLYAERRGKPLAGDKTPGYIRRMDRIHAVWPRARFVHIVRDPRDLFLSMRDWPIAEATVGQDGTWALDPAVSTALYWRYSLAAGRQAAAKLAPGRYHEVRYEDLVGSPEAQLADIAEFLELPFAVEMTRFYERGHRTEAELSATIDRRSLRATGERWMPPTAKLRDWRAQLPSGEAERIEAAAGGFLGALGYERSATRPSPTVRDHVARVQETFTQHLIARGRELPTDW
jgi:hypothetical protein